MKAKVRGIYSTALTKVLLDNGFEIVWPSMAIKERFKLKESMDAPDLIIKDKGNLQGAKVLGTGEAVDQFRLILHKNFDDVIIRKWLVTVNGVYKGVIRGGNAKVALVDIGLALGRILREELRGVDESKPILVQVERKKLGSKHPILTTKVKMVGKYALLIPIQKIGVSLKIRDAKKRFELYDLGKQLALQNLGIIWRSAAVAQPINVLKDEVENLIKLRDEIMMKAERAEAPSLIWDGFYYMSVEFPSLSKKRLDEIRAPIVPTLENHHYYKACGGNISSTLDMAEKLLEKGESKEVVERLFHQMIEGQFPMEGSIISIEHVKLSGRVIKLGEAIVKELKGDEISFQRVFKKAGTYDCLKTKKEPGDLAISEVKLGEWYLKTKYFSQCGQFKGAYININTPIELYPHKLHYVDLEVDICILPDGTVKVVDEAKLERALKNQVISEKLAQIVKEKVREVVKDVLKVASSPSKSMNLRSQ